MVLDSGATSHMVKDIKILSDVTEINKSVILADDSTIMAEAIGSTMIIDSDGREMKIQNVLYVPNLANNLMSVTKLVDDNKIVTFEQTGAKIKDSQGENLVAIKRQSDFFVVDTQLATRKIESVNTATEDEIFLWHQRLGHVNFKYMKEMTKNNCVYNFDVKMDNYDKPCEVCIESKFKRSPFKRVKVAQSEDILDLLHIDVVGPLKKSSIGKAKYILMILDDFSRMTFPQYLKEKSETPEVLKNVIQQLETQTGKKVKRVRSDNGTENINTELREYFTNKGIRHELSVVFSPSQNGRAENCNRILIEGTRALLIDSQLSTDFWAEACNCFSYVRNRTPNKNNMSKTPFEIFYKRKPTIGHLRRFGCQAYFWIPKHKREHKFAKTASLGLFVGYSRQRKAFRIMSPKTLEISEARDVRFLESKMGKTLLEEAKNTVSADYDIFSYDLYLNEIQNTGDTIPDTTENNFDQNVDNGGRASENDDSNSDTNVADAPLSPQRTPRRNRQNVNYFEDPLSDEDDEPISDHDTSYSPGDAILNVKTNDDTPNTYEEALKSPSSNFWKNAMQDELMALNKHQVWEMQKPPKNSKVIRSRWVFKKKINADTGETRYRARLVAIGASQRPGIDFIDVYSPVLKNDTFRTLMAVAVEKDLLISHLDIKTAYLYSKILEPIYMEPPPGHEYLGGPDNLKCRLLKSLYGLKQSSLNWFKKLSEILGDMGFNPLISDPCVFKREQNGKEAIIGFYVDDLLILSADSQTREKVISELNQKFETRDITNENNFLGIEIRRSKDQIKLTQTAYINEVLERFNMTNCHPANTPMNINTKLDDCQDSPEVDRTSFQELMGSLMYIATHTRPDINNALTDLSRFNTSPTQLHLSCLKRVLRYLKATASQGLTFSKNSESKLESYADASWRCGRDRQKSMTGMIYIYNGNVISWQAKLQYNVCLSSCQAELTAVMSTVKKGVYLQTLLQELTDFKERPTTIFTDNQATIFICNNGVTKDKTQHLVRSVAFVHQYIKKGEFSLVYKQSINNIADFLTKAITANQLKKYLSQLRLIDD